jgi:hypothetical protein
MTLRGFETTYAVFVVLHLVAQPTNLITQFSDAYSAEPLAARALAFAYRPQRLPNLTPAVP